MASSSHPGSSDSASPLYGHDGGQHLDHHTAVNHHDDHDKLELQRMVMMMKEQASLEIPPGWRFCPTDEELIYFYLIRKLNGITPPANGRIIELNIYKYDPMILAASFRLPEDTDMFFFTPRDRKYPNGARPKRQAKGGYWKATGADRIVLRNGRRIGYRTTLVFYIGKSKGVKTNWIMQEYTIEKKKAPKKTSVTGENTQLDECVLCKVYENTRNKKKSNEASAVLDNDEDEASSSARRSQAQEDQALPSLHNSLGPPRNTNGGGNSSFSNQTGQYILNPHNVPALGHGSITPFGSTNYGFGLHQQVPNFAPMPHAEQEMQALFNSTNTVFNGSTTYHHSTQYVFGPQSAPMYNNGSQLDNNGYGMVPMDATETFLLDEPLPDFDFAFNDTGEGVHFGMPVEYAEPPTSVPPISPAMQSTQTDGKSTTRSNR